MANMTKEQMVSVVAERTGNTKAESAKVFNTLIAAIGDAIYAGNAVTLPGIGRLEPVTVKGRNHNNPKTGEKIFTPEHKSVKFRMSPSFKEELNGGAA